MSKKISPADRITDFFMTEPLSECAVVFNNVKRILFNRQYAGQTPKPTTKKVVRTRKPKTQPLSPTSVQTATEQ